MCLEPGLLGLFGSQYSTHCTPDFRSGAGKDTQEQITLKAAPYGTTEAMSKGQFQQEFGF